MTASRLDAETQTLEPPEVEYLASLTGRWEPVEDIVEGLIVEVREPVLSGDGIPMQIPKHARGYVLKVDADGDAYIRFPMFAATGMRERQCIFKHDFVKLFYLRA